MAEYDALVRSGKITRWEHDVLLPGMRALEASGLSDREVGCAIVQVVGLQRAAEAAGREPPNFHESLRILKVGRHG